MDFQSIRKEYEDQGIDESCLDDSPIRQLELWMQDAAERSPGHWFETNAMALATSDPTGHVTVRYVLLKEIVPQGIRFFSNYNSAKAGQLGANPNCSVALHWPFLGRQVRIVGVAEKTSREISEQYFHSRPRGAQLSAAVSPQSAKIASRTELELLMHALDSQLEGAPVPLPEGWGGYEIKPTEFEFWQGRTNRLHDRIAYQRATETADWTRQRLAP